MKFKGIGLTNTSWWLLAAWLLPTGAGRAWAELCADKVEAYVSDPLPADIQAEETR